MKSKTTEQTSKKLKKIAVLISELQKELYDLTGSKLFVPDSTEFCSVSKDHTIDKKINQVLTLLGTPGSINGYEMIKSSLKYLYEKKRKVYYTKELYPSIAKKFSKTPTAVERNIRHAILVTCKKGNKEFVKELFPHFDNIEMGIPVNIFLSRVLEYVKKDF